MIGMELIREIVNCTLLTGRIKDDSPVGILLVAAPEQGKTSIVLESNYASTVDITDATGRGITEILKYKPEVSHLLFNDLTAIMAHGKTVRAYTVAMINAMTEEGIRTIAFPGQVETFQNGKRGIIACLTPDLMVDGRAWWNKIGLTSRLLPFYYAHGHDLILKIKDAIDLDEKMIKPNTLAFPKVPLTVIIPPKFTSQIRHIADLKSKELGDGTGYRRLKQFRRLAKAHAISRRNWKKCEVTQDDVDFLSRIMPLISYTKAAEL